MPEELRYDNRVVVVTGAGAGLGRTYALLFASRGASVVVNDLGSGRHGDGTSTKAADTVVAEIRKNGGKAVANYDNVLEGEKIIKTAIDTFGRVDVVINNAGILRDKSFAKMSESDWDIIHNVHLKGSVKTTQAAWPYFLKQKYGRVIVTTSNSGLYGNFGQANYSSAKMGLIGLANTLAIEGKSKNIHTNVIVPTAASRLTEDIIPPDFWSQLKPELIAPVVFWLCHENCQENGAIIESALGWAGKCHLIRSSGRVLRQDLTEQVTPETVKENWSGITDMSGAKRFESINEATGELLGVLETLQSGKGMPKKEGYAFQHTYNSRDVIVYALGVGATVQESSDLAYLYENHERFAAVPCLYVLYGPMGFMQAMSDPTILDSIKGVEIDPTRTLHGEQYLEIYKPVPTEAKVETRFKIQDVLDKGKGAVLLVEHETFDLVSGEKLSKGQMSAFIVGAGGFQGKRSSPHTVPTVDPPKRRPDMSISQKTTIDQAALYRMSGDLNPLHIDPSIATMAGYKRPILHGLCSLGFSVRHVIQAYADGDSTLFKAVKARFAKPVLPGQTLRTDMWQNGNRIYFETYVVDDNVKIISGAYVDLLSVKPKREVPNVCSASDDLASTAIFGQMRDYVNANPDQMKKINAVFLYNITVDGSPKSQWTLDLKKGEVHKGGPKSGKADATLTVDDKDMVEMALGKLNPQVAFMKGKLKITGNIMLTQKLKSLMETAKAKM